MQTNRLTTPLSGRSFLSLIVGVTLAPNLLALVKLSGAGAMSAAAGSGLHAFQLLAAPHVLATLYLFFDRRDLAGIPQPAVTLLAVPALLFAVNCAVLAVAPMPLVLAYMMVFVVFTIWHFGRQNVGLVSLANRIEGRRPDRLERFTLNLGIVAGLLGAYRAFAPQGFLLSPGPWRLDLSLIDPVLSELWYAGLVVFAILIPLALYRVLTSYRARDVLAPVLYVASVFFFLPMYVSRNPLFTVGTWAFAHGVQYLVVLAFHAGNRSQARTGMTATLPFLLFLLPLFAGVGLWQYGGYLRVAGSDWEIRISVALLNGLTLVHYWVERYLWRFSVPERRAWLEESFSFLRPSIDAAPDRKQAAEIA